MERATVTLTLDGRPTLADYASALANFRQLIDLASGTAPITWEIDALDVSSASTTTVGLAEDRAVLDTSTRLVLEVARQRRDTGAVVDPRFAAPLASLVALLNGRVPSLRFETAEDDVTIASETISEDASRVLPLRNIEPTLGAVEGRVQTLSSRGSLRFTLYDLAFDKAVSCYLVQDQQDLMRDVWGRLATVEGLIRRDPLSGRPTSIRQVTHIQLRSDGLPGAWRGAAGSLRAVGEYEPSEVSIRRLRDA